MHAVWLSKLLVAEQASQVEHERLVDGFHAGTL